MSPMKQSNNYDSSNYGESVIPNVLATCYIVDAMGSLKGLHYCSTGANGLPSPPSSPPLVAITSSNELAILPKDRSKARDIPGRRMRSRRGGATHLIREECVRFFCETMRAVFCGERNSVDNGSGLMDVDSLATPPDNRFSLLHDDRARRPTAFSGGGAVSISAWAEVYDYVGGTSYRAFVADHNNEKTLFAFLDSSLVDMELKQGLMALIELAESALGCERIVICIDRDISRSQAQGLLKSFRWVGFDLVTLDFLANDLDVTSEKWLFMGMEV
ncbi:Ornithine decarboxylase antizyme [Scedosporium apiospermum]|uniref:Ornithine decarboxylase antizyme n=1 Tax=Pseudallescheria apiosperma TaxID=563466 RepID=A0A084FUA0_PSEDA|nr:Ornithine decarboxylase antizyme [Scedosporium apiospermum]KEZ38662.1 Ornithine decarboxylase antizyme [Scedosporium apiospermum]